MVSALELPRFVRESASTTYREAQAADLITGRSIESMAAAAVYATCRCAGFAVSTSEVADVAVCTEDQVNRDYMVLNVELGLETPIVQPESRIPKLATACGLSHTCSTVLMSWRWRPSTMAWRTAGVRQGVAAGCLYSAVLEYGLLTTQEEIAAAADVSVETVRSRYHELQDLGATVGSKH